MIIFSLLACQQEYGYSDVKPDEHNPANPHPQTNEPETTPPDPSMPLDFMISSCLGITGTFCPELTADGLPDPDCLDDVEAGNAAIISEVEDNVLGPNGLTFDDLLMKKTSVTAWVHYGLEDVTSGNEVTGMIFTFGDNRELLGQLDTGSIFYTDSAAGYGYMTGLNLPSVRCMVKRTPGEVPYSDYNDVTSMRNVFVGANELFMSQDSPSQSYRDTADNNVSSLHQTIADQDSLSITIDTRAERGVDYDYKDFNPGQSYEINASESVISVTGEAFLSLGEAMSGQTGFENCTGNSGYDVCQKSVLFWKGSLD